MGTDARSHAFIHAADAPGKRFHDIERECWPALHECQKPVARDWRLDGVFHCNGACRARRAIDERDLAEDATWSNPVDDNAVIANLYRT